MSSGRTFDIEDTSSRITKSDARNTVQVTLIHEQFPDQQIEDNVSETDPDWDRKIDFSSLIDQSLIKKKDYLLGQHEFLPLVEKIVTMISSLRDQYFYEIDLQMSNILVT